MKYITLFCEMSFNCPEKTFIRRYLKHENGANIFKVVVEFFYAFPIAVF